MKILFLTKRFLPDIGGVEKHVFEIANILAKKNHQVTVIAEEPDKKPYFKYKKLKNINVFHIPKFKDDKLKKFKIWFFLIKKNKIIQDTDIVHCHDVFFWYLPFRFIYPTKSVYTTFHGYETKFPISKKAIFIRKLSEKLSFGSICVGDYISKYYGAKPNYIIYGGAKKAQNKNLFATGLKTQDFNLELKICFIGRLDIDTGVKIYLEALNLLKKEKINYRFKSFGDGVLKKDVKKYGKANGFVMNVEKEIERTDIVFASSYLAILDALIQKKIVIAVYSNELKKDYLKMSPFSRFIYICKNANEVLEVIKLVNTNSWKSKSMVENGYKWASNHAWENIVKIYYKLWKI